MSRHTVKRDDKTGEITHVRIMHDVMLSNRDFQKWLSHPVTQDEIFAFCSIESAEDAVKEMQEIANLDYSAEHFRFDVMKYNEIFEDQIIYD